jgi:ribose transport system permease protein
VYLIMAAVVVFFVLRAPGFGTLATASNIGRQTAAVLIVAIGMTVVIVCAEIDLSVGSMVSLSGAVASVLMDSGVSWILATLAALALGVVVGMVNGFISGYLGVPSFLVTIGMLEVLAALAQIVTGTQSVPITNSSFSAVFGNGSIIGIPITVWWAILACVVGAFFLHKTVFGRWVYATGGNRMAAVYSGIKTRRVVLIAFMISGLLAAFSGILLSGRFAAGDPTVGDGLELSAIAAVILGGTDLFGGRGTILGSVIGALFIGIVGIGLILLGAGAQLQLLITGAIIVIAVSINKLGSLRGKTG